MEENRYPCSFSSMYFAMSGTRALFKTLCARISGVTSSQSLNLNKRGISESGNKQRKKLRTAHVSPHNGKANFHIDNLVAECFQLARFLCRADPYQDDSSMSTYAQLSVIE